MDSSQRVTKFQAIYPANLQKQNAVLSPKNKFLQMSFAPETFLIKPNQNSSYTVSKVTSLQSLEQAHQLQSSAQVTKQNNGESPRSQTQIAEQSILMKSYANSQNTSTVSSPQRPPNQKKSPFTTLDRIYNPGWGLENPDKALKKQLYNQAYKGHLRTDEPTFMSQFEIGGIKNLPQLYTTGDHVHKIDKKLKLSFKDLDRLPVRIQRDIVEAKMQQLNLQSKQKQAQRKQKVFSPKVSSIQNDAMFQQLQKEMQVLQDNQQKQDKIYHSDKRNRREQQVSLSHNEFSLLVMDSLVSQNNTASSRENIDQTCGSIGFSQETERVYTTSKACTISPKQNNIMVRENDHQKHCFSNRKTINFKVNSQKVDQNVSLKSPLSRNGETRQSDQTSGQILLKSNQSPNYVSKLLSRQGQNDCVNHFKIKEMDTKSDISQVELKSNYKSSNIFSHQKVELPMSEYLKNTNEYNLYIKSPLDVLEPVEHLIRPIKKSTTNTNSTLSPFQKCSLKLQDTIQPLSPLNLKYQPFSSTINKTKAEIYQSKNIMNKSNKRADIRVQARNKLKSREAKKGATPKAQGTARSAIGSDSTKTASETPLQFCENGDLYGPLRNIKEFYERKDYVRTQN